MAKTKTTKKETLRAMDGSGEVEVEVSTDLSTEEGRANAICPSCGVFIDGHRCRLCGAVKTVNTVSGNLIWMRNGRLIKAFHDEKQAFVEMAKQWGIPEDEWPKEFKE